MIFFQKKSRLFKRIWCLFIIGRQVRRQETRPVVRFSVFFYGHAELFDEHLIQVSAAGESGLETDIRNIEICVPHKVVGTLKTDICQVFLERNAEIVAEVVRGIIGGDMLQVRQGVQRNLFHIMCTDIVGEMIEPYRIQLHGIRFFLGDDGAAAVVEKAVQDIENHGSTFEVMKGFFTEVPVGARKQPGEQGLVKRAGTVPDDITVGPEIMESGVDCCIKGILNLEGENHRFFPGAVKGVHLVPADDVDIMLNQGIMGILYKEIHFSIENYTDFHIIVAMRRAGDHIHQKDLQVVHDAVFHYFNFFFLLHMGSCMH